MTIYILSKDPAECAASLDDKSLGKMISAIAQVLCNVCYWSSHYGQYTETPDKYYKDDVPLKPTDKKDLYQWSQWTRECLANYSALLALAKACCEEWIFRNNEQATYLLSTDDSRERIIIMRGLTIKKHKHHDVIEWCENNKPELPDLLYSTKHTAYEVAIEGKRTHTNWPLVMPEKYYVYTNDLIKSKSYVKPEHNPYKAFEHQLNIIESYRNYYRARLQNRLKKCECFCHQCEMSYCICIEYTRREKPEWLAG